MDSLPERASSSLFDLRMFTYSLNFWFRKQTPSISVALGGVGHESSRNPTEQCRLGYARELCRLVGKIVFLSVQCFSHTLTPLACG